MYKIVRKQGDAVVTVGEKWNVQSNARGYANRGNFGKENRDWILVTEEEAQAITDAESFDGFLVKDTQVAPVLESPDLDSGEEVNEVPAIPTRKRTLADKLSGKK